MATRVDLGAVIGPQGPQGNTGPQGERGETGPAGPQGEQGIQGPPGSTQSYVLFQKEFITTENQINFGWTNYNFNPGTNALQLYINGVRQSGSAFTEHADGLGITLKSGLPEGYRVFISGFQMVADLQGPKGEKGPKGDTGAMGPKGDAGATGPQGADGISVSSVLQTTTSSVDGGANVITVTLSDGTKSTFTVKNGSKGSTGETGVAGPKGDIGATGPQGPKGEKGDTGATGSQGPQGEKGDPGARGAIGPQGPQGEKGETGNTGLQGPKGETGPQGPMGPAGADGTKIYAQASSPSGVASGTVWLAI